jgi:hypothetical protein
MTSGKGLERAMRTGRRTMDDAGNCGASLLYVRRDLRQSLGQREIRAAQRYRQTFPRRTGLQILCRFLIADVVRYNLCPTTRKPFRNGPTDAASAAGYDEGAVQFERTVGLGHPRHRLDGISICLMESYPEQIL